MYNQENEIKMVYLPLQHALGALCRADSHEPSLYNSIFQRPTSGYGVQGLLVLANFSAGIAKML